MRIFSLLMFVGTLLLTGCSSMKMQPVENPTVQASPQGSAQVVFMRSAFSGNAIDASLYDVTDGQTRFVGILANNTKVAYPVAPGHRVFMVVSEAADFLEADLVAGKTYYSLVTPRIGMWKARFSMWPVSRDPKAEYSLQSSDFQGWVNDTRLVTNSPKSLSWFEQHKSDVEAKRAEYWPVWKKKTPQDLELRSLKASDGQ